MQPAHISYHCISEAHTHSQHCIRSISARSWVHFASMYMLLFIIVQWCVSIMALPDALLGIAALAALASDDVDGFVVDHAVVDISDDEAAHLPPARVANMDALARLGHLRQPAVKVSWARRSPQLLAHARAALALKYGQQQQQQQQGQLQELRHQIGEVQLHFPVIARVVGLIGKKRPHESRDHISEARAAKLLRLAFQPTIPKNIGISPQRLACFAAQLVHELQQHGLRALLYRCAVFRRESLQHIVVLCVSHEFDGTKQMVAQAQIQRLGRPARRRVGAEVLAQRCNLFVVLSSPFDTVTITEKFICKPIVLVGQKAKTAPFQVKALEMCKALDFEDPSVCEAVGAATDYVIEDLRCDKANANLPVVRHFCSVLQDKVGNGLPETSCCEVHVTNRVKNNAHGIRAMVGKLYSLGNLMKLASTLDTIIDNIEAIVRRDMIRVVAKPPPNNYDKWFRIFDDLFDLHSPHHTRQVTSRNAVGASELVSDVYLLMQMMNDDPASTRMVHYCWDPEVHGPCCVSVEDAREKLTVRLINVFVSPAFPVPTMSRFTYMLKALTRLIAGFASKQIFSRSFGKRSAAAAVQHEHANVGEVGARDSDMYTINNLRVRTVGEWLAKPSSAWEMPLTFICFVTVSKFEYWLFPDKDATKAPTVSEMLDRFGSPLAVCMTALWNLLSVWHFGPGRPWQLMGFLGFDSASSHEQMRRYARREVLVLAAGMKLHFDNKYSRFPWRLNRLLSDQWSEHEKQEVRRDMCNPLVLRPCCGSSFVRHMQRLFPTPESLNSRRATCVLQAWRAGKAFETLTSEMAHASSRKALHASNAPGRSFHHHARVDVISQRRVVHLAGHGDNPSVARSPKVQPSRAEVQPGPWRQLMPGRDFDDCDDAVQWADVIGLPQLLDDPRGPLALMNVADADVAAPPDQPVALAQRASGRGGSSFMTFMNSRMRAKRAALGRRLIEQEREDVVTVAKRQWQGMSDDARRPYIHSYRLQVAQRQCAGDQPVVAAHPPPPPYIRHLGSGSRELPATAKQFCAFYSMSTGFPSNGEVFTPTTGHVVRDSDVRQPGELQGHLLCTALSPTLCTALSSTLMHLLF